jgi:hypothetical protein
MAQINKPDTYFNTVLYTGNGSTQSITGVNFQPDWVWIKSRGDTSNHRIYDGVRGATKVIYSNLTNVEGTDPNGLTSFDSDGFSLGTEGQSNGSGVNFVSWNWLASNTTASNTDGTITSTVSANTTSGFSIVSYTGTGANATVGHGLGVAPNVVICKSRTAIQGWESYFSALGATQTIRLDSAAVPQTASSRWNNTAPTSSVFSLGTEVAVNGSGASLIAYCFAEKKGFSKFGSYTGNASADGAFIYTGFSPSFVIIKNIDAAESWSMFDGKRPDSNQTNGRYQLQPNTSSAEYQGAPLIDFVSNGFKLRTATDSLNVTQNYIYMCFAEQPLVGDNPATAR